jgi:hypothetical protein
MEFDFTGVMDLSQEIGGVPVCVSAAVSDPNSHLTIGAGTTNVQGIQALEFLRTRDAFYDGSDIGREQATHIFLSSLLRKVKASATLTNISQMQSIAETVSKYTTVDNGLDSATALFDLADDFGEVDSDRVTFLTMPWQQDTTRTTRATRTGSRWTEARRSSRTSRTTSPSRPRTESGVAASASASTSTDSTASPSTSPSAERPVDRRASRRAARARARRARRPHGHPTSFGVRHAQRDRVGRGQGAPDARRRRQRLGHHRPLPDGAGAGLPGRLRLHRGQQRDRDPGLDDAGLLRHGGPPRRRSWPPRSTCPPRRLRTPAPARRSCSPSAPTGPTGSTYSAANSSYSASAAISVPSDSYEENGANSTSAFTANPDYETGSSGSSGSSQ